LKLINYFIYLFIVIFSLSIFILLFIFTFYFSIVILTLFTIVSFFHCFLSYRFLLLYYSLTY